MSCGGTGLCLKCQLACLCVCLLGRFQYLEILHQSLAFFSLSFCLDKSSKQEKEDRQGRNPHKVENRPGNVGVVLWPFFIQILIPTQYSAWVRKELGWAILTYSLLPLLWSLGLPEVKPLTGVVWGIPCCSPNCAGKAEAALLWCGRGNEVQGRVGAP